MSEFNEVAVKRLACKGCNSRCAGEGPMGNTQPRSTLLAMEEFQRLERSEVHVEMRQIEPR